MISGVLGWAVRQDAITTVVTRNTTAISTKSRKQPRALTVDEIAEWQQLLAADEAAVRHDLIDLTAFELATGMRVGEVLGVAWDAVNLVGTEMVVDIGSVVTHLARGRPVFPNSQGGWRDPSNTLREIRKARGKRFTWVPAHVFRKTAATLLDEAGLTARAIANQMGHVQISMTQDRYLGRGAVDAGAAAALESGLRNLFSMHKPCTDLGNESQRLA